MLKKRIKAGWLGTQNEEVFFKKYSHPSKGLNLFLQNLIKDIEKNNFDSEIEIHFNSQFSFSGAKKYLIILEHPYIRPQNLFIFPKRYKQVFGWDLNLKKLTNFTYVKYPHFWNTAKKGTKREIRYSMVCSNRNILLGNPDFSLYNKRQEIIDFCEKNPSINFHLYGTNWDSINCKAGLIYKFLELADKLGFWSLKRKLKLNNYKGQIKNKFNLLCNSKFNICFENISNYPGYISEKIWDSIAAGSIPVYWPSWKIPNDYIPNEYFIDASKFSDPKNLFNFLESIPEEEINQWSNMLIDFSKTKKEELSIEKYSKTIIEKIKNT